MVNGPLPCRVATLDRPTPLHLEQLVTTVQGSIYCDMRESIPLTAQHCSCSGQAPKLHRPGDGLVLSSSTHSEGCSYRAGFMLSFRKSMSVCTDAPMVKWTQSRTVQPRPITPLGMTSKPFDADPDNAWPSHGQHPILVCRLQAWLYETPTLAALWTLVVGPSALFRGFTAPSIGLNARRRSSPFMVCYENLELRQAGYSTQEDVFAPVEQMWRCWMVRCHLAMSFCSPRQHDP
ncbi:hypothetical protein BDW42DRAFT_118931 [Aspergillus taichungensis]|uniref:Uncharacterized protein n=1 Tax=Aspergillus taichungensis TaxID=482145 RepID=A0A2J5HRP5_9EURO|nr:hypothetical protein BDW42DRAFT_118931 [Aspergillus taichungensis]